MSDIANIQLEGATYPLKDTVARTNLAALGNRVTALETPGDLVIIGDSHSTTMNVPAENGWYTIVGKKLGLTVHNFAVGGAGYVREVGARNVNFSKEVDNAVADSSFANDNVKVVIVYGGLNDISDLYAASLPSACAALVDKINLNFPNAKVFVVGINSGPNNFLIGNSLSTLYNWFLMRQACAGKQAIFINSCFWNRKGKASNNPYYNNENYHPNVLGDANVAANMINAMFGNTNIIASSWPNVCTYTASTGTGRLDISATGDMLVISGNATLNSNGIAEFEDSNYYMDNLFSPQYLAFVNPTTFHAGELTFDWSTHKLTVRGTANEAYYFRAQVNLNI